MKVFKVIFSCSNCGNEWTEDFEKGDILEGTWLKSHRCTYDHSCKYCRRIKCPVCGNNNWFGHPKVDVKERTPIKQEAKP